VGVFFLGSSQCDFFLRVRPHRDALPLSGPVSALSVNLSSSVVCFDPRRPVQLSTSLFFLHSPHPPGR